MNRIFFWKTWNNTFDDFDVTQELLGARIDRHFWDEEEPRIVLCQISDDQRSLLISLFITADSQEVLVQDAVSVGIRQKLIGTNIPKVLVLDESIKIVALKLESLAALEEHNDKSTRDALLSFGCHLRRGRVEQAYQVVKSLSRYTFKYVSIY